MTGQQWYSVTDAEAQERLEAAWEDAPIENLETLGYILTTARLQVIAYAPASAVAYLPSTLTWPDGSTVKLSRDGDIITAAVTPANPAALPAGTQEVPEMFAPAGIGYQISLSNKPTSTDGRYLLNLIETGTGVTAQFLSTGNLPPFEPFTTMWAGDAADATGVPENYVYAQLQQAINLWNAGRTDGNGGVGAEGWSFVPRPLDKVIRNIIRPIDGKPDVY
jgi:hypothetical protein